MQVSLHEISFYFISVLAIWWMKDLQGCISLVLSGHYVPQLAQLIYEQNKGIQNPIINLKGFMVDL